MLRWPRLSLGGWQAVWTVCSANNCRSCGVTVAITSADRLLTSCRCGVGVLAGPGSTKVLAVAGGGAGGLGWCLPDSPRSVVARTGAQRMFSSASFDTSEDCPHARGCFPLGGMVVLQQYSVRPVNSV
ncbi:hypothetical protein BaRGS_00031745 [Batillaria attramentaria]|uniref:Secreted protein n=1 Tax=Batillaria attramentaria TaxID=370345 RepID=A0ABD0JPV4_9CAEN